MVIPGLAGYNHTIPEQIRPPAGTEIPQFVVASQDSHRIRPNVNTMQLQLDEMPMFKIGP